MTMEGWLSDGNSVTRNLLSGNHQAESISSFRVNAQIAAPLYRTSLVFITT
jgi:hypothetical protein